MERTTAHVRTVVRRTANTVPLGLERMLSVAAAALVLYFWGATLTWAAMLLVAAILFQDSLRVVLAGLTAFLSRTNALKVYLGENRSFEFSAPVASEVLQKIADEIKTALARLSDDQTELFLFIIQNSEVRRETLANGPLKFARVRPRTVLHWDLRDLRDIGLARPAETGRWEEVKHPMITPFGELAYTIFFEGRNYNATYIEHYLSERAHQSSARQREV